MKAIIVYHSEHHGNTLKVVSAIADKYNVQLVNVDQPKLVDFSKFDLIGVASGIYFGNFKQSLIDFVEQKLPKSKNVFLIYTHGAQDNGDSDSIRRVLAKKGANIIGAFQCRGLDT